MSNKVWIITGASRGFGRVWADAALKRGDKVQDADAVALLVRPEFYETDEKAKQELGGSPN